MEAFDFGNPVVPDQSDGGQHYALATGHSASTSGVQEGNRWRAPTVGPGTQCRMGLYRASDQVLIAQSNLFTANPGQDNDISFTAPAAIVAGVSYRSVVVTNRYCFTINAAWPFATASMIAPAGDNGFLALTTSGTLTFPTDPSSNDVCYFVGPMFEPDVASSRRPTIIIAAGRRWVGGLRRASLLLRTPTYPILTGVPVRYDITGPGLKWQVTMTTTHVSVLSREFLPFDVSAYVAGRPYNPTGCAFAVAFLESSRGEPVDLDWVTGDWDTTTIGTYVGRVLVGPGSGAVLAAGRYYPWVRITDPTSGEIVVRQVGKLFID